MRTRRRIRSDGVHHDAYASPPQDFITIKDEENEDDEDFDIPIPMYRTSNSGGSEMTGASVKREASTASLLPDSSPQPKRTRRIVSEKEVRAKLRDTEQKRAKERKLRIANDKKIKTLTSSLAEKTKALGEANATFVKSLLEKDRALDDAKSTSSNNNAAIHELEQIRKQNLILQQNMNGKNDHATRIAARVTELKQDVESRDDSIKKLTQERNELKAEVEQLRVFKAAILQLT